LLVTAVVVRSAQKYFSGDPGLAYHQLLAVNPGFATRPYTNAAARAYLEAAESRLRAVSGVADVAMATAPPFTIAGQFIPVAQGYARADHISAGFFRATEIPLLRGREFTQGESGVVIVNDRLAEQMWPGEEPIGKPFNYNGKPFTVIGVASRPRVDPSSQHGMRAYFPLVDNFLDAQIVIRTTTAPESLAANVRAVTRAVDPTLIPEARTSLSLHRELRQGSRRASLAFFALGITGLLLAVTGIFGLLVYTVAQRTREIGVRVALGATRTNIAAVVLRQLTLPITAGSASGILVGCLSLFFLTVGGAREIDLTICIVVMTVFLTAAALATVHPLFRALKLNPTEALRHE
jgi:hypothetical protein